MNNSDDPSILKENFQTQLSELEMLQSAFCNPGEIKIDDYAAIADMEDYINDKIKILPTQLNFTINLKIDDFTVYLCVNFPPKYPMVKPEIFVRIDSQNRTQQQKLNMDLKNFILSLEDGEICIFSIITWLQDNISNYIQVEAETKEEADKQDTCTRFWIYSHHIYNKMKRKEILSLANDYSLTGFCLPGKPGIICIEGFSKDCNAFWSYIKSMTWKKIMCRNVETDSQQNIQAFRKFKSFEEIAFQCEGGRSNHMNMGEFNLYLVLHNCEYMFKELFGLDTKST